MYNRYIPQSDGSYRRHSFPEKTTPQHRPQTPEYPHPPEICEEDPPECNGCPGSGPQPREIPSGKYRCDFLRNLLPRNLNSDDLLILALLLLMSADCREDQNLPLLTLALYLFL